DSGAAHAVQSFYALLSVLGKRQRRPSGLLRAGARYLLHGDASRRQHGEPVGDLILRRGGQAQDRHQGAHTEHGAQGGERGAAGTLHQASRHLADECGDPEPGSRNVHLSSLSRPSRITTVRSALAATLLSWVIITIVCPL